MSDGSVYEPSEPDTGVNGHPAELDVELPASSSSSSTLEEEGDESTSLEDFLLDGVALFFGDFDWDLPDDPELMALLTRD